MPLMWKLLAGFGGDGPFGPGRGMHRDDRHLALFWLVIVALLAAAVLITWLITRRRPALPGGIAGVVPPAPMASSTASAETILAERLARSEISPDDYRSLLAALRGTPPPSE